MPNGDIDELDQVIEGPNDDLETYQPEETVRGKRAKRKAEKLTTGGDAPATAKTAKKKKPGYRVPALVERVWYEAGSVILRQLVALIGGDAHIVESIKQSKRLLEMELVSPDAFAEVFGGRADFLRMKRPELRKLAQKAGFKGLSSASLEKMQTDPGVRVLAYISIENYRFWRQAQEDELRASFSSGMLPDEPTWLEEIVNERKDVFLVYRQTLEGRLRLPHGITRSMPYMRGHDRLDYCRYPWRVYCYRASVAIRAASLWREFTRLPELDFGQIISERTDLRLSLDAEKSVRKDIWDRVDDLRKKWKEVGADLDAVLGDAGFRRAWPLTFSFLGGSGVKNATRSVQAAQTMMKYKDVSSVVNETAALSVYDKNKRLEQVIKAWREHNLEDVELLGVNMLATKYPVTKRYIDSGSWSLEIALEARLLMRDLKMEKEEEMSFLVQQLPRHSIGNHVYVCPCGYFAGMHKMELHLRKHLGKHKAMKTPIL